jgi:hypothetical protein
MFRHLQVTLIGAAIIAAVVTLVGSVWWVFMQIPHHPYVLSTIVFVLLSWAIGLVVTDNMK